MVGSGAGKVEDCMMGELDEGSEDPVSVAMDIELELRGTLVGMLEVRLVVVAVEVISGAFRGNREEVDRWEGDEAVDVVQELLGPRFVVAAVIGLKLVRATSSKVVFVVPPTTTLSHTLAAEEDEGGGKEYVSNWRWRGVEVLGIETSFQMFGLLVLMGGVEGPAIVEGVSETRLATSLTPETVVAHDPPIGGSMVGFEGAEEKKFVGKEAEVVKADMEKGDAIEG
ncbi:hypothetical protein HK102_007301 [Quaeritorhiza haematococci]|nr:hypothetical protein HK102_007301 [Quaeritorhiza haematococci]